MENWTALSFGTDDVNSEETAVRQRLHTAVESAFAAYMAASKRQDIIGIEIFPS
jgi:hypothetical protein